MNQTDIVAPKNKGVGLLLGLASTKLLLHLVTNLVGGYGYFRDELYYLACSQHLAWGYVDQPPLSIWLLALNRALFGDSVFALRLLPALAGAATVFIIALMARELGGGRLAQLLAGGAAIVSLLGLGFATIYSMNAFDLLLAALVCLLLVRLIRSGDPRYWLPIGAVLGLGLLNKIGMLWIGLGVGMGVLASRERRHLGTRWPWLGAFVAGLLFLPYVLWNAGHEWAHLEFIRNAVSSKYSGVSVLDFLAGQLMVNNPVTLPVWLSGLVYLLASPSGRRFRPLAVLWLSAAVVLTINGHSKPEYLVSAYAGLFAAGGVALESWLAMPRLRLLRFVVPAIVALGLILAPVTLPILPPDVYVDYTQALGIEPSTAEGHDLAELHQFYADMFGWPEKAEAVARVYGSLSSEEKVRTVIFGTNYGRAGAIDLFGPRHGLPRAIGGHNNYWLWGPGSGDAEIVIVVGGRLEDVERSFESVEQVETASCNYCIPYERDLPIYLARRPRLPIAELWPRLKHYI